MVMRDHVRRNAHLVEALWLYGWRVLTRPSCSCARVVRWMERVPDGDGSDSSKEG